MTEAGDVRPHINVFLGQDRIRSTRGLDTPLPDGGELLILPVVSGS